MYKWKLVFELTSGKTLEAFHAGEERDTDSVAHKILDGENNQFIGLGGAVEINSNLFIKRGCIAALDIFPKQ